jgi:epoxyqueuosine reductase
LDTQVYTAEAYGQERLPGREGVCSRPLCNVQMQRDVARARVQTVGGFDEPIKIIKYCRNCEMACPVGK